MVDNDNCGPTSPKSVDLIEEFRRTRKSAEEVQDDCRERRRAHERRLAQAEWIATKCIASRDVPELTKLVFSDPRDRLV